MTSKPDGGPAFPNHHDHGMYGMALRDWFAGMAMQGLVMSGRTYPEHIAKDAYEIADAMIAEREK